MWFLPLASEDSLSVSLSGAACSPCACCGQSRPPRLQTRTSGLGVLPKDSWSARVLPTLPAPGREHGAVGLDGWGFLHTPPLSSYVTSHRALGELPLHRGLPAWGRQRPFPLLGCEVHEKLTSRAALINHSVGTRPDAGEREKSSFCQGQEVSLDLLDSLCSDEGRVTQPRGQDTS